MKSNKIYCHPFCYTILIWVLCLNAAFSQNFKLEFPSEKTIEVLQGELKNIKKKQGKKSLEYSRKLIEIALTQKENDALETAKKTLLEVDKLVISLAKSKTSYEDESIALALYIGKLKSDFDLKEGSGLDDNLITNTLSNASFLTVFSIMECLALNYGVQSSEYQLNWSDAISYKTTVEEEKLWLMLVKHTIEEYGDGSEEHVSTVFRQSIFYSRIKNDEKYQKTRAWVETKWPNSYTSLASNVNLKPDSSKSPQKEPDYELTEDSKIVMPRFPGCEELKEPDEAKKRCADQKLLRFIYENIKYPTVARENAIQGMVVASFTVTQYGTIVDISITKKVGGGCDEEVTRLINLMNELPDRWQPGIIDGKEVRVKYNLPVRFKLN